MLLAGLAGLERSHLVVPLGLVTVKSKPPMNAPQLICLAFRRSPTFFPPIRMVTPCEQMSPTGSRSATSVRPWFRPLQAFWRWL